MKYIYYLLFLNIAFNVSAEFKTDLILQNYKWSEYNNEKLLQEKGYLKGVCFSYNYISSKFLIGDVDYDGQRWNGEPLKTTTDYFFINTELNKQYKIINFATGIDIWKRTLGNNNLEVGGYTEYWNMFYTKFGINYNIFNINYCIPIYCENNVHSITLNPNPDPFFIFTVDLDIKKYFIGCEYKSVDFKKSGEQKSGNRYLYQPESKEQTFSLFFGIKL